MADIKYELNRFADIQIDKSSLERLETYQEMIICFVIFLFSKQTKRLAKDFYRHSYVPNPQHYLMPFPTITKCWGDQRHHDPMQSYLSHPVSYEKQIQQNELL
ncbi:MAG: hypothetical protein CSA26_08100 [Desulfobacterales bacterium]|nr:MAG: hypothetical protein CSA26_08100 [Desulfobacterales bacterium]